LATFYKLSYNLAILEFLISKSGEFGPFFLHEKSFVQVETMFFRSKFGENSPIKESLVRTQDHTQGLYFKFIK
jgi:hypothetical protein